MAIFPPASAKGVHEPIATGPKTIAPQPSSPFSVPPAGQNGVKTPIVGGHTSLGLQPKTAGFAKAALIARVRNKLKAKVPKGRPASIGGGGGGTGGSGFGKGDTDADGM